MSIGYTRCAALKIRTVVGKWPLVPAMLDR